jgi:hypothetical protein
MNNPEATISEITPVNEITSMTEQELRDEIVKVNDDIHTSKYSIKLQKAADLAIYRNFFTKEAKWKNREAFAVEGILEVLKLSKDTTIELSNVELEGIYYFLERAEGEGIQSASKFALMYKSILPHLEIAAKKVNRLNALEKQLAIVLTPKDDQVGEEVVPA